VDSRLLVIDAQYLDLIAGAHGIQTDSVLGGMR
jgi:hypothetical protein